MKVINTLILSALIAGPLHASFPAGSNTFASASTIPTSTTQDTSSPTTIDAFTAEAGEPDFTGVKHTAWWKWTAPANGWATFHTGSNPSANPVVSPHIAVYTGSSVSNLVLLNRSKSSIGNDEDKVTIYVAAGSTVCIQVDSSWLSHYGEAVLGLRFMPAASISISGSGQVFNTARYSLNMTANGAVTGSLAYGSSAFTLRGTASADGFFSALIPRRPVNGQPVAPLKFVVDLVPDTSKKHRTWIQDGLIAPDFLLGQHAQTFTKASPQPLSPRFTGVINHPSGMGRGYFTATISPLGVVTLAGRTGDGKPFTSSSRLCEGLPSQYLAPLGRGAGRFTGALEFADMMGSPDTIGCVDGYYDRPSAANTKFYPIGYSAAVSVTGAAYSAPAAGQRALGLLNGTNGMGNLNLEAAVDEYMDTTLSLNFTIANRFVFPASVNKPALIINKLTGVVSGSVQAPVGKARALLGILVLEGSTPRIRGHVTGTTRTGAFSVMP